MLLMGLALVGLISFQMYWINNAIDISRDRFKKGVQDALNAVSEQLEKQEVVYTAAQQLQFSQGGKSWIGMDSIKFSRRSTVESGGGFLLRDQDVRKFYFKPDSIAEQQRRLIVDIESDQPYSNGEGVWIDEDVLVEINKYKANIDSIVEYSESEGRSIKKVNEKQELVTIVVNELFSKERALANRIDPRQLQVLLDASLKDRGIDIEFEYGVIDGNQSNIVLTNTSGNQGELLSSDYRTKLFPRDIIPSQNTLVVFFPNQETFLLGKIWLSLTSSILLVLVIIGIFGYAIYTIITQKKISQIKSDFINNMTHEFKTPISTVSLACEALQDEDVKKNGNFLNRYISIIDAENKRLGMQVEKVLQMATLEKQDFKLKLEILDMHEIIDRALENINIQIEKRSGTINKRFEASKKTVLADEVHLTNIIYNLLDNANKYSREKPEISISTKNARQGIVVRITDRGIGMSKEVLGKIFERFYREPTGNLHDVKGFGLGLTYVKTMLDALGGSIAVKSDVAKGSTFEIYLPQNG